MSFSKKILIVGTSRQDEDTLEKIVKDKYNAVKIRGRAQLLKFLKEKGGEPEGIIIHLNSNQDEVSGLVEEIEKIKHIKEIPVIIIAEEKNLEYEQYILQLGAWDYISSPYTEEIILLRLEKAINRSKINTFKKLKHMAEFDPLTGIYNKNKLFELSSEMIKKHPDIQFAFLRFDIDRFQLINSFFGKAEGDKLLKFVASRIKALTEKYKYITFGRIEADVFGICMANKGNDIIDVMERAKEELGEYNKDYDIVPNCGIYIIDETNLPMETIFDRATLASKISKGNYVEFYAFYNEQLSNALVKEQAITNEMTEALTNEQFLVYLQPKYDLQSNKSAGAEALVRWQHPTQGFIPPSDFIPVFEKNGFITEMDYYVWEKVCQLLKKWIDRGIGPNPISVNVSRVHLYNPNLVDNLIELVKKYDVPPELLNLELTESAYTDNPIAMVETIKKLQNEGFVIMMDDFGSGYSSLNVLKDLKVDVLKIDLRFLETSKYEGRGESIMASVIRMAIWLNIPVVAEGVETKKQAEFLRSLGCKFVQGYYFARPMPISQYEAEFEGQCHAESKRDLPEEQDEFDIEEFWSSEAQVNLIFNKIIGAVGIYELSNEGLELIRANEELFDMLSRKKRNKFINASKSILEVVAESDRKKVMDAFKKAIGSTGITECTYKRVEGYSDATWVHIKIKYIYGTGKTHLFYGVLDDITEQKNSEIKKDLQMDEQRKLIEYIYENIPCGMAHFELDGGFKFKTANKAAMKMFGFTKEDLDKKDIYWDNFVDNEYLNIALVKVKELEHLPEEGSLNLEYPITSNGETKWIRDFTQLFNKNSGGKIYHAVFTDITEQKRLEQELENLKQSAKLS